MPARATIAARISSARRRLPFSGAGGAAGVAACGLISDVMAWGPWQDLDGWRCWSRLRGRRARGRSEEHTSELQSLMRISYAVFCLKNKKTDTKCKRQ